MYSCVYFVNIILKCLKFHLFINIILRQQVCPIVKSKKKSFMYENEKSSLLIIILKQYR